MRRLFCLGLLVAAACFAAPAVAQAPAGFAGGIYLFEGRWPDGSRYRGRLTVLEAPNGAWAAVRELGHLSMRGTGIMDHGMLAVGFLAAPGEPGLALFRVAADGSLHGRWNTGGAVAEELLSRQ